MVQWVLNFLVKRCWTLLFCFNLGTNSSVAYQLSCALWREMRCQITIIIIINLCYFFSLTVVKILKMSLILELYHSAEISSFSVNRLKSVYFSVALEYQTVAIQAIYY
jgi:hypothetical protein